MELRQTDLTALADELRETFNYGPPGVFESDMDLEGIAGRNWWEIPEDLLARCTYGISGFKTTRQVAYYSVAILYECIKAMAIADAQRCEKTFSILSDFLEDGYLVGEGWRYDFERAFTPSEFKLVGRVLSTFEVMNKEFIRLLPEQWAEMLAEFQAWSRGGPQKQVPEEWRFRRGG